MVFDNVFVPWDRVFMFKEYEFAGRLVEDFASYHRQSYACKAGVGDVLIGAAQTAAEYNGAAKASHVKDKIIEMNHLNETLFCGSVACACEGHKEPSGTYLVNTLLANVCKQNVTRFPYEIARLAQDIAGGLMVTLPSEQDFRSPEVGHWLEKYYKGNNPAVSTEDRMRILRLIENITLGTAAVGYLTESMHGAGSPQAQRIMISRQVNMDQKQEGGQASLRHRGISRAWVLLGPEILRRLLRPTTTGRSWPDHTMAQAAGRPGGMGLPTRTPEAEHLAGDRRMRKRLRGPGAL